MSNTDRNEMPVSRIRDLIVYDPAEGSFSWKGKTRHNMPAVGKKAGGMRNKYYYIRIDNIDYPAARIAWVILYGSMPDGKVMFKDGDSKNLRANNLILKNRVIKDSDQSYYQALTANERKHRSLKYSFGIGLREYEEMLVSQNGKCDICKKRETAKRVGKDIALSVDHCHETGDVRGLLCNACNKGLGHFNDDPIALTNAISYLSKHKEKKTATNIVAFKKV